MYIEEVSPEEALLAGEALCLSSIYPAIACQQSPGLWALIERRWCKDTLYLRLPSLILPCSSIPEADLCVQLLNVLVEGLPLSDISRLLGCHMLPALACRHLLAMPQA